MSGEMSSFVYNDSNDFFFIYYEVLKVLKCITAGWQTCIKSLLQIQTINVTFFCAKKRGLAQLNKSQKGNGWTGLEMSRSEEQLRYVICLRRSCQEEGTEKGLRAYHLNKVLKPLLS